MLTDEGSWNIAEAIIDELLHFEEDEFMSCFDRDLTGSGSDDAIDESGHRLCQIGAYLIISLMIDHMSERLL